MQFLRTMLVPVFVAALFVGGNAQDLAKTGTTAAQFLKIPVGARAMGMGTAFTATASDASAMYWNPAGMAHGMQSRAMFNHVDWIADVAYDYAAVGAVLPGIGTVGAFVGALSMDEMEVRTIEQPEGTGEMFGMNSLVLGVNYARQLTDHFSIGMNVKYLSESLWHMEASSVALDVGVLYRIDILNEFRIGASISNFGTKMQLDGRDIYEVIEVGENRLNAKMELDEWDLPLIFRAGVAADVVRQNDFRVTLGADAVHPNDHTEHVNTGAEVGWREMVFLRGGYGYLFERDTERGLTLGAGVDYELLGVMNVLFDYAYQDFGRLKETHYLSVGLKF